MRYRSSIIRIAALTALLAVVAGCRGAAKGSAYDRWGITKPVGDDWAEARLASGYELIYRLEYQDALKEYENVVERFPNSAEAHLGKSIALRYLGRLDEAAVESEQALKLDPEAVGLLLNHGDLLAPTRGAAWPTPMSEEERRELSNEFEKRAAAVKHPLAVYAHTQLWANYFGNGELTKSRAELRALGEAGYFPTVLEELAYNMLVGLEPDAVLFTNGDNDTYPLFVLQEHGGFRPDVRVVNLNLLNLPKVAKMLRDSLGVPIAMTDEQIGRLRAEKDMATGRLKLPADFLVGEIVRESRKSKRPVYFAITVHDDRRRDYEGQLVLEGMVYRIGDEANGGRADREKIARNLAEVYRLGNLFADEPWPENLSPITRRVEPLGVNYAVLYHEVASHHRERNAAEDASRCYREAVRLLEHAGVKDGARSVCEEWLEYRPDDPEARQAKQRLGQS